MYKVSLDLHDWSVLNNRLDLLWRLREHYPDFRVSLFAVPDDIKHKSGSRHEALIRIKECLDWIQIIPHGFRHNSAEARKWDYEQFMDEIIPGVKEAFDRDGLPFEKGFCAPHWTWSDDVVRALDALGWWGAISPKREDLPSTKKFYIYTHSLDEPFLQSNRDVIKLHGHIHPLCKDDLEKNFDNLLKLPKDISWHFVTDFIEENI